MLSWLARIGEYVPSTPKPVRKPELGKRLLYTFLVLLVFYLMSSTYAFPLSAYPHIQGIQLPTLINVIFASQSGSLTQLGIGPLVTAGLIIQILAGAKLIDLDLTDPEDRRLFTQSQKGLALLIAVVEGLGFALYYRLNMFLTAAIFLQFLAGALILMVLDEAMQKGYGIGSGVSLFILAGIARTVLWSILAPVEISGTNQYYGIVPYLVSVFQRGVPDMNRLVFGIVVAGSEHLTAPSLVGFVALFVLVVIIVYLQDMKVNIPITSHRMPGVKSGMPLQFLYVSNIPILLVGILFSDLILFYRLASSYLAGVPWLTDAFGTAVHYLNPPSSLLEVIINPVRVSVYAVLLVGLAVLFGLMWVEVAGLNPSAQAENLARSGLLIPGHRSNPKAFEVVLSKYIYPLAILSSIIVALVSLVADIFGVYGSGMGILLAVGILQQFYAQITYERALEAYPLLKKLLGE
ncbi:MAG: preprotein translocase subunit SecY [Desulfurococcaceae archaeon TW002]